MPPHPENPTWSGVDPSSSAAPLVLVTGASGYVALHCVNQLLRAGYRTRGTVRSLKNASKIEPLRRLPNQHLLELVEADLEKPNDWPRQVIRGTIPIPHIDL
uniref:Epimerase domain-containing protein n=1 Tax=Panagrellus redivivus TaxID=6233 RepID=A0A7E4VNX0_PANRE